MVIVSPVGGVVLGAAPGMLGAPAAGSAPAGGAGVSPEAFGALCTGTLGGGRCSACQRSQRNSAENEKITNRIRRWVSMKRGSRRWRSDDRSGNRIVTTGVVRVAPSNAPRREPRSLGRAVAFAGFPAIVGA